MIITSFCGLGAQGNRHHVVVLEDSNLDFKAAIDLQVPPHLIHPQENTVVLWQQRGAWHARFFDCGHPVRRCGSGNIAIAAYLYTLFQQPFSRTLHTIAGALTLGADKTGVYYCDRPCQITAQTNAAHWAYLCQTPVINAVRMGGRQDYTLVLLPDTNALSRLRLRSHALGLYSARSVIALAPAEQHWQLRYFAPQYGVPEDSATGSACVQASVYLARTSNARRCTFVQRSSAGGIIYTEQRSRLVVVRGDYRLPPS